MNYVLAVGCKDHMGNPLRVALPDECSGMNVVEAGNLDEGIRVLKSAIHFKALIVFLQSRDLRALSNVQAIREKHPRLPTLALFDAHNDQRGTITAVRAILASLRNNEGNLLESIGNRLRPEQPRDDRPDLAQGRGNTARPESEVCLTQRQIEVLYLIKMGKANKEIARELAVSEGTIKAHCMAIYRELGVNNRTQAAIAAGKLALFTIPNSIGDSATHTPAGHAGLHGWS